MKTKIFGALAVLVLVAVGCVSTVGGDKTAGVPFLKDKITSKYDKPADEVFRAAEDVVRFNGVLISERTLFGRTNAVNNLTKVIEGKVNQRAVWVAVEQITDKTTEVAVQVRTHGGGSDIELAAEIDKRIALKLQTAH